MVLSIGSHKCRILDLHNLADLENPRVKNKRGRPLSNLSLSFSLFTKP